MKQQACGLAESFFGGIQIIQPNLMLVGGLEHSLFFHILGIIFPIDFHSIIFQRGRYTTNQDALEA